MLSLILTTVSGLFSAFVTWLIFFKQRKSTLSKEQYQKVVFPIFHALEPHLFKKIDDEVIYTLYTVEKIINNNNMLVNGILRDAFDCCTPIHKCSQDNFSHLCKCANNEFDKHCKLLGISPRPFIYRLRKNQFYYKKFSVAFYIFLNVSMLLVGVACFIFLTAVFFSILASVLKVPLPL